MRFNWIDCAPIVLGDVVNRFMAGVALWYWINEIVNDCFIGFIIVIEYDWLTKPGPTLSTNLVGLVDTTIGS